MSSKADMTKLVTPVFDPVMGHRLRLLRMYLLLTQTQLAERLTTVDRKITQQTIAELEAGRTRYGHFTLGRMTEVLGFGRVEYVLLGINAAAIESRDISGRYWKEKLKARVGQKRRGNPHFHLKRQVKTE